ncbi:MAG TPA: efflux RND transporter periplasmic adaptor subunit [Methylomirabilota bacterium]|nr:efflux RND transporter periplasmic adaptor subunit [Methylomirabilota bacterium]
MTQAPLFSSSWYRVAELQPRLRSHAHIHRHRYRGQTWYVLEDRASQRHHRFTPQAHLLIGLMDGQRTVQELWEMACDRLGDESPTQDEVIQLLSQLHAGDVLQCDVPPDAAELLARHERQQRRRQLGRVASVFSWRFPLVDPDRFLKATVPLVRPLLGWTGAVVWLAVVVPALLLLGIHWTDLTQGFLDRLFSAQTLVVLWLLFPVIKALHELGHAFATKAFGGEVHDMGVMLLVFSPVPYVDASSASAFRSKWHRIVVGAAGMLVELFLAALALYVWLSVEPGALSAVAYNTILIAGLSTVLFNANPLLRYDGYYILADLLEIPNLRQRANAYLGFLCERYLFGRREAEPPIATSGERAWFVAYATASFVYRVLIVVAIIAFIADHYFWLAMFFAGATAAAWIGVPVAKGVRFLVTSPRLRRRRLRALGVTAAAVGAVVLTVGWVPVPYRTVTEGVVWIPEESLVRAGTEGFVERVVATPGARVRRGDALIVLRDPEVRTRMEVLRARVRELQARHDEQQPVSVVKAAILLEELRYAQEDLARASERASELTIRSGTGGTFVVPTPEDLPGRFVKKGEQLAYVVEFGNVTVRAVVPQSAIDLIRFHSRQVEVRLTDRLTDVVHGVMRRVVPGASEQLPTTALGSEGGGQIVVDPRDPKGVTATQKVFQVDVELPIASPRLNVGGRAYVRFDHGWEPLAVQWYLAVRQLFLSRFSV